MSDGFARHFSRSEFACRCGCGYDAIDRLLVMTLDDIRDYYRRPIIITSGCRCAEHNRAIGGATNSYHLVGKAADFVVSGIEPSAVADYLERKLKGYGIGRYRRWTHLDTRGVDARWRG